MSIVTDIRICDPVEKIIDFSREKDTDLIVMGIIRLKESQE